MKQNLLLKNVLKKLEENHIDVRKENLTKPQKHIIFTDTVVIILDETNRLILSFDVDVRPDFSAFLTVQLSKVPGIKDVLIGELFMNDPKNQTILTGNEAVKQFMKVSKQAAVSEFIKEQMTEFMLRSNAKIPSC